MFLNFRGTPPEQRHQPDSTSQERERLGRPKAKKRAQVAQACDWCRVHRTKCDNSRPCRNCIARGASCGKTRGSDVRSLPQAFREVQRLTQRVRELELELARHDTGTATVPSASPSWAGSSVTVTSTDSTQPEGQGPPRSNHQPQRSWEGVYASTTPSSPKQWYGASSLFYFIGRMEVYMSRTLQHPRAERTTWFNPGAKSLPSLASGPESSADKSAAATGETGVVSISQAGHRKNGGGRGQNRKSGESSLEYLNASQEEYFLGLFWQSHHCSLQIVDEASFREHYRLLCSDPPPGCFRGPSALVDIIIALCMQYGVAFLPRQGAELAGGGEDGDNQNDSALAGWRHYQRGRVMLESEMERPTLSTVQGLVFAVIYLCCANFQNTAHHVLAFAVRVSYTLGLHLEPPQCISRSEKELRKRLFWAVYVTEAKTCMKLGRPWSYPEVLIPENLPADDHELALQTGTNTACMTMDGQTVTWLTYTKQNAKLVLAAQTVYVSLFDRRAGALNLARSTRSLYDDPSALEPAASVLEHHMASPKGLKTWATDLPTALKTQRAEQGIPLSTDLSRLDIEIVAPAWLQRQRLFLELLYHTFMINLHRPFIVFPAAPRRAAEPAPQSPTSSTPPPAPSPPGPLATAHASTAARHAIAITAIIRQVVAETDLLKGWHEAFQQQWNAAMTLVGFVLAFPAEDHDLALQTRGAVGGAIEVFEAFGEHFSVGGSAASATRELLAKVDLVLAQGVLRQSVTSMEEGHQEVVLLGAGGQAAQEIMTPGVSFFGHNGPQLGGSLVEMNDEAVAAAGRDMLGGTLDMVYSADSFLSDPYMGMDGWPAGFY